MKRILLFILSVVLFCSCKRQVLYEEYDPIFKTGDDVAWAAKSLNETGWRQERGSTGRQVFWIREKTELIDNSGGALGLQIIAFGAYEIYWDGVKIGINGKPGSPIVDEVPGNETIILPVPDSLSKPGKHTVALRSTQFSYPRVQRNVGVKLDTYVNLIRRPLLISSLMFIMAGAFLVASLYYIFLYFNSHKKQYPVLIFSVICLLFFLLLITEYLKFYIEIPYPKFFIRMEVIGWLTFSISLLVPLYFCIQFGIKRKYLLLCLLFGVLLFIYIHNYGHYDLSAIYYSRTMWFTMLLIAFDAVYRKQKGSWLLMAGILASAGMNYYLLYDFGIFIFYTFIVLSMLYLHTIRMKKIEQEHSNSLLLSSRLQLELLKKNIQPHFIKNTLTSLIDWVEESPKKGTEFIQALANEFDIMNAISEQSLIPIRQEIALCQMHLKVMGFRKEISYEWEDSGIITSATIPPAIIHTLLENGITHNTSQGNGTIRFKLSFSQTDDFCQYTFETLGKNRELQADRSGGNGFRYIKARLEESYPGCWKFSSAASAQGWMSIIKISNKSK
ncbi:histidine kinase [Pedobacter sp. ISL-68]|uniref:histidine kinase n=1 Tax=unclassified Pedobacter TaxID=2628915 RepID=UPI001BEC4A0C|nr:MULTISPECIES: sensor histidine kinase [unclassified Pedobacter]MBT2560271.1 histidine kinase [Pedobacter sp. ISL-64]MBT2589251.1 histidine kinase [Pedobacter sp. ISL-68]